MRRLLLATALLGLSAAASAQDFDAARGAIFDQPFVQRLPAIEADARLGGPAVLQQFHQFAWLNAPEPPLPPGITRQGPQLIIRSGRRLPLRLRDDQRTPRGDDGDRQRFTYLRSVAGYHLIAVRFDHDAPHALLVDTRSPAVIFVNTPEP